MKSELFWIGLGVILMSGCASYRRVGDLNMIQNRNIDSGKEYVLIQRNVEAKATMKKDDALERAIDAATEKYKGDYMMNVKVYVRENGAKIKVEGDVWGLKENNISVQTSVNKKIELQTGDMAAFHSTGKIIEGKIIGINEKGAIIEYNDKNGITKRKQVPFEKITKIEK